MTLDSNFLGPAGTPDRIHELARREARYHLARRTLVIVVGFAAAAMLTLLVVNTVQARSTAAQVQRCTTPGNSCYDALREQNTANRAQLLADIQEAIRGGSTNGERAVALNTENRRTLLAVCKALDLPAAECGPPPER